MKPRRSTNCTYIITVLPLRRLPAAAQVLHGVTCPLGAGVEGALAQALHHSQVAAAVHADAGRPRVGQLLAAHRPYGDGLPIGLGHMGTFSREGQAITRAAIRPGPGLWRAGPVLCLLL